MNSNKAKVVLVNYGPGGLDDIVATNGPDELEIVKIDGHASEEAQIEVLKDADALFFIFGGRMPEVVLRQAARLRFIQLMSAGYDYLDIDLLKELGISFATTGNVNSAAVAEHTIALILAVARKLARADAATRAGGWLFQELSINPYTYGELFEKRVGIVGLGNIGRNVAQRLLGFECDLQYYSPRPIPEEQERELGVKHVGIEELFETSDIVTLHVPLTSATKHMVNRDRLERMKPSAILINTTRGAVVDETALIEALQEGNIYGAGLDVFEIEPPAKDNPLFRLDNVVVTPHVGGGSSGTQKRIISYCWQNIRDALEGREPRNVVNQI